MSYGDVDQFDVSRNTRYLLPLELDKKLYTADQISEMLARGRDPLELSIDKWERLAEVLNILYKKTSPEKYLHNLQDRIGYKTCALCIASIEKYTTLHGKIKVKEDKCSVCPLARVDRCIDSKSAYMGIERIIKKFVENRVEEGAIRDTLQELSYDVQRMVVNLKSIQRILQKKKKRR